MGCAERRKKGGEAGSSIEEQVPRGAGRISEKEKGGNDPNGKFSVSIYIFTTCGCGQRLSTPRDSPTTGASRAIRA